MSPDCSCFAPLMEGRLRKCVYYNAAVCVAIELPSTIMPSFAARFDRNEIDVRSVGFDDVRKFATIMKDAKYYVEANPDECKQALGGHVDEKAFIAGDPAFQLKYVSMDHADATISATHLVGSTVEAAVLKAGECDMPGNLVVVYNGRVTVVDPTDPGHRYVALLDFGITVDNDDTAINSASFLQTDGKWRAAALTVSNIPYKNWHAREYEPEPNANVKDEFDPLGQSPIFDCDYSRHDEPRAALTAVMLLIDSSRPYGFCFLSDSDSTFLYVAERNTSGGIEVRRVSYAAEVLPRIAPGMKNGMRFKFMTVALHLSDIIVAPQICPQGVKISPRHMYFAADADADDDDVSFTHIHRRGFPGPHPVLEPLPPASFPCECVSYVFPGRPVAIDLEAPAPCRQSQLPARPLPDPSWVSEDPRQIQHNSALGSRKPNEHNHGVLAEESFLASFEAPVDHSFSFKGEARLPEPTRRAIRSEHGASDLCGLSISSPAFSPGQLQTTQDSASGSREYHSLHQQVLDTKYSEVHRKSNGLKDSDTTPNFKLHNGEEKKAEKKRGRSAPPEDAPHHVGKNIKRERGVWRRAFGFFKPGTESALKVVQE